jgi:hypothetical protein
MLRGHKGPAAAGARGALEAAAATAAAGGGGQAGAGRAPASSQAALVKQHEHISSCEAKVERRARVQGLGGYRARVQGLGG